MQHEARYYDFINALPPGTVNKHGWVVANCMPFYESGPAVVYTMSRFPEAKPSDHLIILNPVRCRELALVMLPEYEYLLEHIEKQRETVRAKLDAMVAQRDAIEEKSILDTVQKEVLQGQVKELIGIHSGLIDAWQTAHARKCELWNCGRLKDERV